MSGNVIVNGARTPIGKLSGALKSLSAVDLGAHAISAALTASGVRPDQVDQIIFGNVVQAGVGPNPARRAATAAGIPLSAPALTLNNLCLSGLESIRHADRLLTAGEADVVVAGGMESMTNAPHLVTGARGGLRYGPSTLDDALDRDALVCAFDGISMGAATERYQKAEPLTREELDSFSARSHQLAGAATASGAFNAEIAPISIVSRRQTIVIDTDEGIRPDTTTESLGSLRPAFSPEGLITAGSSSQLSDGACALVVMRRDTCEALGLSWLAEIRSHAFVAGPDTSLLHQPAAAITAALQRDGQPSADELDFVEINEAFAGVALASINDLGLDSKKVNVHGGAIALGHPVGMSGARLALTLALTLQRRGGSLGAAALCGGGGQGNAIILEANSQL
ncbi:acetyl-CoA C-acyltransferase [Rhodococcus sp. IEGM 1366]|uniref:acetyl-CoA C-acyltransferase n=1 Tax=Rhodococcus sp. IEGM 1366 TaxID=3082223 RepID=UPI0029532F9E|nr:acetyl-CoA C-acyltransferase [Rhodococcus sp. IEGM 1366]MDV8071331.1 acetyl-CoA C-acyltransferase [Rhodococcus sp. IEGM 1366]